MKRIVISTLLVTTAAFAVACGGATNTNNSNVNKNAVLAPNVNTTPAAAVPANTVSPVNVNKTAGPAAVNGNNKVGPARPVDEKLRIMRESANAAPKNVPPPPPAKKTP